MGPIARNDRRPGVTKDWAAVDSGIDEMNRRADVLRLFIEKWIEVCRRAAIIGRQAEVQIDDPSGESTQQGFRKQVGSENGDRIGDVG